MKKSKGRKTKVAGVIALGNGSYRVRARAIDPRTGKMAERDRLIHGATLKRASKEKEELIAEIRGEKAVVERRTLHDYATSWLRGQWNSLCPTTRDRYLTALDNHILPAFGGVYLDAIRVEALESWRDVQREKLASASVNGHLRLLRAILARAVRTEGLRVNPAAEVRVLPEDDRRITDEEPNSLEPEELRRFLTVARDNHPQHYPMILMLFTTGARMSAVRALRWDDVDPEKGLIVIRRRVSGKELIPGVKRSRTSKDVVPLHPELWKALRKHRASFNEVQRLSGLVFPSEAGGVRAGSVLAKPFEDILEVAQIHKRFTPHGCRRTSTDLYRRATTEVVTKSITGHLTTEMHEHYSTVTVSEKRAAAKRAFAEIFRSGGSSGGSKSEVGEKTKTAGGALTPSGRDD